MNIIIRSFAWAGGALFVGALLYGAYFYTIVLATPGQPGGAIAGPLLIDVMLFSLFAAHHSVFAHAAVKRRLSTVIPSDATRTVYVWMASLLWFLVCIGWQNLPGVVYSIDGPTSWPFYAIQLAGVLLTVVGAAVIQPLTLAGITQIAATTDRPTLRVVGPFRFVRHPIYFAWLLMVFGTPLMTVNRLIFAVVSSAYLVIAIPWEERALVATFGDRYRAYQRRVRWHLLPPIW